MKLIRNSRSGVALIVVLGLVAILMIVCVSFTINMRVERAGAANLRHGTVATQIAKGALASAIATIDDDIGDRGVPNWYNTNDLSAAYYTKTYKDNNKTVRTNFWSGTFISRNADNADERLDASFFTPEVEKYFPPGMAYKGFATSFLPASSAQDGKGGVAIKKPEWIPVYADKSTEGKNQKDKEKSSGKEVIGRYAFIAMDTSGLLDVSTVAHGGARWMGLNPSEIQLSPDIFVPEFSSKPVQKGKPSPEALSDAKEFINNLIADGRYESFAELRAMNESDNVNITNCMSFNTFSFEPTGDEDLIDISSLEKIKKNKMDIIHAFYDCGLQAGKSFGNKDCEQARWAYLGLVDYVDEDSQMEDDDKVKPWQRPATEDMPLMAGFIAKVTFQRRELAIEKTNPETGEKYYEKDPNNCEYKVSGDFKIPFTRLGRGDFDTGSGISVEGAVRFARHPEGDADTADFVGQYLREEHASASAKPEGRGEAYLTNLKICNVKDDSKGWGKMPNLQPNVPRPLKDGFKIYVQARGATIHNKGGAQHRYPLNASQYNDEEEGLWMTVPLDCAYSDIEFGEATTFTLTASGGSKIELKKWETSVVVWAEFLDPRFACLDMEDKAGEDELEYETHFLRYLVSHGNEDAARNEHPHTIPITKFKEFSSTKKAFKDVKTEVSASEFDKDEEGGGYFGLYKGRSSWPGASPIAWYMLTHPAVSKDFYKINVDGIRVDDRDEEESTDVGDAKWRSFVKNGPLESVGELGYLPIGPWYTIRLYDYDNEKFINKKNEDSFDFLNTFSHLPGEIDSDAEVEGFHPVLNYFSITNAIGRVNINTAGENALASVFYRMPIGIGEDPLYEASEDGKSAKTDNTRYRISADDALLLAKALINCRQEAPFEGLADLGYVFSGDGASLVGDDIGLAVEAVANTARNDNFGEFEREAVIRNSCGLFTMRGQSFVIAVRGESYSPMYGRETSMEGGSVNAAKTAVAQIWRDTEPDATGKRPIFVQFFKLLDN